MSLSVCIWELIYQIKVDPQLDFYQLWDYEKTEDAGVDTSRGHNKLQNRLFIYEDCWQIELFLKPMVVVNTKKKEFPKCTLVWLHSMLEKKNPTSPKLIYRYC